MVFVDLPDTRLEVRCALTCNVVADVVTGDGERLVGLSFGGETLRRENDNAERFVKKELVESMIVGNALWRGCSYTTKNFLKEEFTQS